ncbi:hypothetical protein EV175_001698 [Coemansia sp. RSA 1933]|nr:hypothetical protein EV175_001698 [Coemansia sp. RSA 1933]
MEGSGGALWRQLYRDLLRAAPRAVSGNRPLTKILVSKIRQGFDEYRCTQQQVSHELLYRKGCNTLGILKLARELGSIERMLVSTVLEMYRKRLNSEIQPPPSRRRMKPLQKKAYDEAFIEYDRVISRIEQELEIILPRDRCNRSLEWIPPIRNLHKGDPLLPPEKHK